MSRNLEKLSNQRLLQLYSELLEELRTRKVVRPSNDPIADYAERVISDRLHLTLVRGSNKGFDARDAKGTRYQIKARRITRHNSSRQLSVIRNLKSKHFDYLIAGMFDEGFVLRELWRIPHSRIKFYARYSKHQNGHILYVRGPLLQDKFVRSLLKN